MGEFSGRVIAVAGAGSGIGAEVARRLVAAGARVALMDRNADALRAVAASVADDADILLLGCDVSDASAVASAMNEVSSGFGRLDGLVNAAGIVVTASFLEFTESDWERCLQINVVGTYLLIQHAVPLMRASGGGRIVNFASMAGKIPNQFTAPYAASKAAVISLTRSAAVALGPDITVNSVCPGIIDTPMWEQLGSELADIGAPIQFASRAAQAPLGRPGTAADVADASIFLLSDAARFITGEDLNVSGGLVMH